MLINLSNAYDAPGTLSGWLSPSNPINFTDLVLFKNKSTHTCVNKMKETSFIK